MEKDSIKYYCVEREIYVLQVEFMCLLQMAKHEKEQEALEE
jgi:hypothetical protein